MIIGHNLLKMARWILQMEHKEAVADCFGLVYYVFGHGFDSMVAKIA